MSYIEMTSVTDSVGGAMSTNWSRGTAHPGYQKVASAVSAEVAYVAARDAERRGGAAPLLLTVALGISDRALLMEEYPEFRVVDWELYSPGHALYVAQAEASNALILQQAGVLADSIIHVGGSLLRSLLTSTKVHVERNVRLMGAQSDILQDMRHTRSIFSNYTQLVKKIGDNGARMRYDAYLSRRGYVACTNPDCSAQAEAMCIDLSKAFMSPSQLAASMLQCGAQVAMGFFPYDHSMMISDAGELSGGVLFEKDYSQNELHLLYPDGPCGEEVISLTEWAAWLTEHVITVGKGRATRHYRLELSKQRGSFMHFTMVVTGAPGEREVGRHTLECGMKEPQYVVKGWALKDLVADPDKASSWRQVAFLAPAKVVSAVYAYGMQLPVGNFSRYAIRRQLLLYDRVTIEGTNITRGYSPGPDQLDLLCTLIHAEVFVQRYESGKLSAELMRHLKSVAGFGSASALEKTKALAVAGVMKLWDGTVGALLSGTTAVFRWIRSVFSPARNVAPRFELAPERVAVEVLYSSWVRSRGRAYTTALKRVQNFNPKVSIGLRGGVLTQAIAAKERCAARMVGDTHVLSGVHFGRVTLDDTPAAVEVSEALDHDDLLDALMSDIRTLNMVDQPSHVRDIVPTVTFDRPVDLEPGREDQDTDAGYVSTLNDVYHEALPGVAEQPMLIDSASLAFDDQERQLQADRMHVPRLPGERPKDREYYVSRIRALGTPKRQETRAELLSAVGARNLSAPHDALPQDESVIHPAIFARFVDTFGVDGAWDLLKGYQREKVFLTEANVVDWGLKAKERPGALKAAVRMVNERQEALLRGDHGHFNLMLKADVKPPLSDKPLRQRIESQTIVYPDKDWIALCSSIFRELSARFLSIIGPNVHVNLRKNMEDIVGFLNATHPFDDPMVQFVENDFSKYDKSQNGFAFRLEAYVFRQLGLDEEFMERWLMGRESCHLASMTTSLSIWLRWQRKSGDPTTAFGNVVYNMLSVCYSYDLKKEHVAWACFMGDDSLIAVRGANINPAAVNVLSEVFNLQAKTYVTNAPYFASWFYVFDKENRRVIGAPDPIKWIERKSMMVAADDPQWRERWISARDSAKSVCSKFDMWWFPTFVASRYSISIESARRLYPAIYTAIQSLENYRALYEAEKTLISY